MITVLKPNTTDDQRHHLIRWFEEQGVQVHEYESECNTVLGLIGNVQNIDVEMLNLLDIVERVTKVTDPFKSANRQFHPEDTIIDVCGAKCGGGHFAVIAGPGSVESEEHIMEMAKLVKAGGATMLRGGAFRPRTSPYAFQGMKTEGIDILEDVKKETGLPIVSEIMNTEYLPLFENVDVIQVGARNMQNFELLKELGKTNKTILLKRGLANTLKELLMSAEYIMSGGNENIILCERGIRTFETYTRNTLDLSAIPVLHKLTHLPVVVDPSHATGEADLVKPMALAAAACGADGLMIEVHNNPARAMCDGQQSITPAEFKELMKSIEQIRACL